ncbi:MAG: DUF4393 domain-containing protein [Verrucomicrobia bacterium]|nr:DUF4393 domain-containing protein [Verrucomicrobiota bacterium]MCH8526613.1 DUF4393 domain-containing protein [Kiritimatiellia bacterium]
MTTLPEALSSLSRPVDTACTLIENLLGEPFKVAGDVLADQVRFWQWNNRVNILEKAQHKLQSRGISPRYLQLGFILPFVEDCADAEEAKLQDLWASLLASAVEKPDTEHVAFVHVLRNLNYTDAHVLEAMIRIGYKRTERNIAISEETGLSLAQVNLSLSNLHRLGFFSPYGTKITLFGASFIRACAIAPEALKEYLTAQKQDKGRIHIE